MKTFYRALNKFDKLEDKLDDINRILDYILSQQISWHKSLEFPYNISEMTLITS